MPVSGDNSGVALKATRSGFRSAAGKKGGEPAVVMRDNFGRIVPFRMITARAE
jgi:hypothetical protein